MLLKLSFVYVFVPLYIETNHLGISSAFSYELLGTFYFESFLIFFVFFVSFISGYKFTTSSSIYFSFYRNAEVKYYVGLTFIMLVCFFIFIAMYGGIQFVLENSSRIRSGYVENKSYLASFINMFSYYSLIVLAALYALINMGKGRGKKIFFVKVCFFILLVFTLFKLFVDGGRGGLIMFLMLFLFSYNLVNDKFPVKISIVVFFVSIFIGLFGKVFLFQIFNDNGLSFSEALGKISFLDGIVKEYSHQYMSVKVILDSNAIGSRYFSDLLLWILKPFKLIGMDGVDSISYYNTYLIRGVWDSEVPPGVIAFSLYQGGVLFLLVYGFFLGFLVKFIDSTITNTMSYSKSPFTIAISVVFLLYMPFLFLNSDPALFVQWSLVYIILFLFMVFSGRLKFYKVC
ncbi:O-antigen polymerase [uncultured Oceanisphaera sp.]|uniref:O-antigen polymerase n=1 Tax=uncultured Oceanisphaera sp. TaxID=353858 RepID=UPI00261E3DC2|nr:O-antigen polymerase [uncultured Oceanisphaera sp.]